MPPPARYGPHAPLLLTATLTVPAGTTQEQFFGPFRPKVWLEHVKTNTGPRAAGSFSLFPMWSFRLPPPPITIADIVFCHFPFLTTTSIIQPDNTSLTVFRQWAPRNNLWLRTSPFNPEAVARLITITLLLYTPYAHYRDG